jgi:L-alanine-DL-glutamate epimerase-like enolase superfamily enzyme
VSTLAHIATSHHAIPLGAGRGGSGATRVDLVIVTIEDSDGATGVGFTFGLTGGAGAARHLIEQDMRAVVTGTRLDHWPATWEKLWNLTHRLGRGHALPAISALDIAVHDLLAVKQGLPLYRYLGAHAER